MSIMFAMLPIKQTKVNKERTVIATVRGSTFFFERAKKPNITAIMPNEILRIPIVIRTTVSRKQAAVTM